MTEFELVLPCYNESKSLETIISKSIEAARTAGYNEKSFQLVLVENGSKDDSGQKLVELSQTKLGIWFRVVTVELNQGYGYGLMQGLMATNAPIVGWSHADQQCDPKDAFLALNKLRSLGESIYFVKGERSGRNWKDVAVSRVFELMAWLILGVRLAEINAQPKVFSRTLLSQLSKPPKTFAFDVYVLYQAKKAGFKFDTVPVLFPPRVYGLSNWASTFFGRYKTILGMIGYMVELSKSEGRL